MRHLFICWTMATSAAICSTANAGIPVIDSANLAQSIEQVLAWARQYRQMEEQRASVTGSRGLGTVHNDPSLQNVVPVDAAQIYAAIHANGTQGLTPDAQQIRNTTRVYNCEGRTGVYEKNCNAQLAKNPQDLAFARNALNITTQRVNQIVGLMNQINATTDPKAIAELQARLQVETTQVANDQNRLLALKAVSDAQQQQIEQQLKEQELLNLSREESGVEDFHYQPRSSLLQP
jgi:type IV secretion system protein VirB5